VEFQESIRQKKGKDKIVMLTAYDYQMARILDETSVDLILVGDSLGMVFQGAEDTKKVTMEDMVYHTKAVARGAQNTHVIGDMPIHSYDTVETAREMGIDSPLAPDLSLALGSSGISLLELTSAYGVFASGGMKARPFGILTVEDPEGNILEAHQPYLERTVDEQTAYLMTQALMGVVEHGTGWRAKALGRPVAGKTGTTNNYVDAWFIGFTPNIVTGVWVGFDEYRTLGDVETGSRAAAPIWVKFMKEYILEHPVNAFPVPSGIKFVPIDRKTGLLATGECPNVFLEAFKEGTEPKKICNAHQISQDHFVSIDMDLSKDGLMLHPQRSDITASTNRIYCSD